MPVSEKPTFQELADGGGRFVRLNSIKGRFCARRAQRPDCSQFNSYTRLPASKSSASTAGLRAGACSASADGNRELARAKAVPIEPVRSKRAIWTLDGLGWPLKIPKR